MRPDHESEILEAAIELFGDAGYTDVSARLIARKASTTTMTVYRIFRNKEHLFEETLRETINLWFDPGKFVLLMYEERKDDFGALLVSALERWYLALPRSAARLIMHASLSTNHKWQEIATAAIEKLVAVLTTSIERQTRGKPAKATSHGPEAGMCAKNVVAALLHMKVTTPRQKSSKAGKQAAADVQNLLHSWFGGVAAIL